MAIEYKSPKQIADQYLLHLKGLKPNVNTEQEDSDWWVRAQVVGGTFAGIYSDLRITADDAFPQSARREALQKHLNLYFDEDFRQPTQSSGFVSVTGSIGASVNIGLQMVYTPNGNVYAASEAVTLTAVTGIVPVESVAAGQSQNLLQGAQLTISSPPPGINNTAEVYGGNLASGRDLETNDEAAARILARIRNPISGGTRSDYEQWAIEADESVTSANVIRYAFGFGSVGIIITGGTTDVDAAIDNGDPVIVTPTQAVVDTVQAYVESKGPITDCVSVSGPVELPVDVTVRVRYSSGNGASIPSGQTLTQEQLVQREVKRAIYKTPVGGRRLGPSGYLVASDIEEVIDIALSDSPHTEGTIKMLSDRQVDDLAATGINRLMLGNQVAIPGTITVVTF